MAQNRFITAPGIYLISFTCYRWYPLIKLVNGYDLVYKWFNVLRSNRHFITGYVIMPNHIHLLLYFSECGQSLNRVIGTGKRFMAYEIVKRLGLQKEDELLSKLQQAVQLKEKKRGKKHEVWKESFNVRECRSAQFIIQQLHQLHHNPCVANWKLAADPLEYSHSSASYYISQEQDGFPVTDYRELIKEDGSIKMNLSDKLEIVTNYPPTHRPSPDGLPNATRFHLFDENRIGSMVQEAGNDRITDKSSNTQNE